MAPSLGLTRIFLALTLALLLTRAPDCTRVHRRARDQRAGRSAQRRGDGPLLRMARGRERSQAHPVCFPTERPGCHPGRSIRGDRGLEGWRRRRQASSSIHPSIHLSIYLSIHPSIDPSIYPSIYPSICPFYRRQGPRAAALCWRRLLRGAAGALPSYHPICWQRLLRGAAGRSRGLQS